MCRVKGIQKGWTVLEVLKLEKVIVPKRSRWREGDGVPWISKLPRSRG